MEKNERTFGILAKMKKQEKAILLKKCQEFSKEFFMERKHANDLKKILGKYPSFYYSFALAYYWGWVAYLLDREYSELPDWMTESRKNKIVIDRFIHSIGGAKKGLEEKMIKSAGGLREV